MEEQRRILSIQSHVVSGYVGNKAAAFPLQLLEFDVDIINSVHLSNHTGYKHVRGDILKGEQLNAILEGLERNGLLGDTSHVLTGYVGSASFLESVVQLVTRLRNKNPTLRFVCDPVLGDMGEFYVPTELVNVYRHRVVPLADVLTPNQFEAEQLTGIEINSIEAAKNVCASLHEMGPSLVFITSFILPSQEQSMSILASERSHDGCTTMWCIDFPVIPGHFTGTGDLCAALLLAHTVISPSTPVALEKAINSMYAVLEKTSEAAGESVRSRELRLIQSKAVIENPPNRFTAKQLR